jgi:hypothetical protein
LPISDTRLTPTTADQTFLAAGRQVIPAWITNLHPQLVLLSVDADDRPILVFEA